ncbi:Hypothetical predicted protein [Olea europaea subsp. europaea]|uniref:Hydroxyproline-rich glycoprotein family protein n=1 Tax=Olea europaea subsp. europaea TaxID=158383 RepID=A0A8S0VDZ5_OLEEU|nr:Hypothetical predicted protein [Olea europaea subsp. europaea]
MPMKDGMTPPPRIGKIGPYTVFVTPPVTPNFSPELNSPIKIAQVPVPVQDRIPVGKPPVQAPPPQFDKERSSSFGFLWDAVVKIQNAHASLDEHIAHWFGLNQSKYQWALDDYYATNGKNQTGSKA